MHGPLRSFTRSSQQTASRTASSVNQKSEFRVFRLEWLSFISSAASSSSPPPRLFVRPSTSASACSISTNWHLAFTECHFISLLCSPPPTMPISISCTPRSTNDYECPRQPQTIQEENVIFCAYSIACDCYSKKIEALMLYPDDFECVLIVAFCLLEKTN